MVSVAVRAIVAMFFLCAFVQARAAQASLEIDDYFRLQRVTALALSSDERWLAYIVETYAADDTLVQRLHLRSLTDDNDTVLDDLSGASELVWIAGTDRFAFLSDRSGSSQVWTYDVNTKRLQASTDSPHPVIAFAFSAGGKRLAYATRAAPARSKSLYDRFREDEQGIVVDAQTTSSHDFLNPNWNTTVRPSPATLWIAAEGAVSQVPVPGELADTEPAFSWSADGRMLSLAHIGNDLPESQLRSERSSVGVFDVKTRRFRTLAKASPPVAGEAGVYYSGGEWIPGTHNIILRRVTERDPWVSDSFPDWTVTNALADELPTAAQWRPIELYPRGLRFVPQSAGRILLSNTHNGVHSLFELTPNGATSAELMSGVDGSSSLFQFGRDFHRVVFVNESLTRPPEIYAHVRGAPVRKLTSLNDEIARKIQYRSREVAWQSTDGVTIKGWLLEPATARGPTPLITFVHGGPAFPFPNSFAPYLAMWPFPFELFANRGMAVFIPNYRGTHTYGRAIASGSDDQAVNDILSGIRSLIAGGVADEQRLGICGHSHGGMLGPRAMVAAKNFRVSSFAEGVASSVVMYELMSGQANREIHDAILGASLYDAPERYIADSPDLKFAGIETASLFEAGAYTSALLMLGFPKAAARAGMPTEFVVYPRTGHNLAIPSLMRESARRNLAWFESRLLNPPPRSP